MSKVAAYIRVSTKDQNLAGQRAEMERYFFSQNIENIEWFIDQCTGANTDRDGFRRLQQAIANRRIDTVVIYKLSRAFRKTLDCLKAVEEWERLGVSLRIIDLGGQPIDTKTAAGKVMLTVMAAIAEMERMNMLEHQRAGIRAARQRHNGKCPWGGRRAGIRNKTTTHEKQRAVIRLFGAGESISAIARTVKLNRRTVYSILSDAGKLRPPPT